MDKTKNVNMKLPTDPKDVAALKTFLEQVRSQVCGMADVLKEPFKSHFNELKNQFDSALSKLPPSEQVPAAMDAHQDLIGLCSCLCSASSLVTALSQKLNGMEEGFASALSSAVDVRLAASLAGGEFVKKADLEGLVTKGWTPNRQGVRGQLLPNNCKRLTLLKKQLDRFPLFSTVLHCFPLFSTVFHPFPLPNFFLAGQDRLVPPEPTP